MRKIVHIIDNLTLGGAEVLLLSTIKRLPQFEHHIILLTSKIQIKDIDKYANIYCLNHSGWHVTFRTCRKLKNLVAMLQPEVVHSHLFLSSFLSRLALGTKYNYVYSLHNLYSATIFKKKYFRLMERAVYNPGHKLIAVSKYVLDDYRNVVDKCKEGLVLYNFIGDAFIFLPEVKKEKSPVSLKKWIAIGSMKYQKNYGLMIDLFQALYNSTPDRENLSLDIYGDGILKSEIEHKIKELRLPITLKGNVRNIAGDLKNYDAYISTSLYEGYGIAPMEALAVGLPLFLSDIPVYKEIYGQYAFFFDITDKSAGSFLKACRSYESMTTIEKSSLLSKSQSYASNTANGNTYIQNLLDIYSMKNSSNTYEKSITLNERE